MTGVQTCALPISYLVSDVLHAMEADAGVDLGTLKADGGASANNYLLQSQADISAAPVLRPRCVETTALGAAYLAGLAVGYWKDTEDIRRNWASDRKFDPALPENQRQRQLQGWKKAVACAAAWEKQEESL